MDRILALFRKLTQKATDDYLNGDISLLDWHLLMKTYIKRENAMMVFAGSGAASPADVRPEQWLVLGNEIKKQFDFLANFVNQIASGAISRAKIISRIDLYLGAAQASFWRTVAPVDLPAQPGDGSTKCLGACGCHWEFEYVKDSFGKIVAVLAYWIMGDKIHCPDCPRRADEWNPLRIAVS